MEAEGIDLDWPDQDMVITFQRKRLDPWKYEQKCSLNIQEWCNYNMKLYNFFKGSCVTSIELIINSSNSFKSLSYSYTFTWIHFLCNSDQVKCSSATLIRLLTFSLQMKIVYLFLTLTCLFISIQSLHNDDESISHSEGRKLDEFHWVGVMNSSSVDEGEVNIFVSETSSFYHQIF